ncbi:MAG: HNH endonuclease [Candidatus Paceibacterota bacterium]
MTCRLKNRYQKNKDNPKYREGVRISKHRREARLKGLPNTLTRIEWEDTVGHFGGKCAYCGTELEYAYKEHFIPLTLKGGTTRDNIIPSCRRCNTNKGTKHPLFWMVGQDRGLLRYVKLFTYLEG